MLDRNRVDEFGDDSGFTCTRSTKDTCFTAACDGRNEVNHFDASFKNFKVLMLFVEFRRDAMNRAGGCAFWRIRFAINRLSKDVKHAPQRGSPYRKMNRLTG